MRGDDLRLRAFYNLCRHRGTPLVDDDGSGRGRVAKIECAYHGWTYACTGALRVAPNTPTDFDRASFGLREVRVAEWQGFVFVCEDEHAPPLAEWMGAIPPWLEDTNLGLAKRSRRVVNEAEANWKLLVANFQESHHFPRVHPELEHWTPTARARSFFPDRSKWLGGEMDIDEDAETVSISGKLGGRALLVAPHRTRIVYDAMLFPALLTSLQPDYFLTYRLEPMHAKRTRIVAEIFVHPGTPPDADMSDVFEFWDVVNAQDRAICERQQRGVSSRGFTEGPKLPADEGVHAFERLVVEAMVK